ncbi:hypothetical protein P7F60_22120 [Rhizobium sp. YJ-22]|uniref:hypothetical protein n=1 Tax=Rhizobium sp. YJ-22 TaxID=3037556 RepID=UPI002412605F|nr:hypothetical protein [Rhizobium sp. YJ-22]MDG3579087.1 hypothetical protein [Rhizobium sp. YJ-22]
MQRHVIEYGGIPVGIAVPQEGRLRFIAVKFHVIDLDNSLHAGVNEIKAAIRAHLSSGHALAA